MWKEIKLLCRIRGKYLAVFGENSRKVFKLFRASSVDFISSTPVQLAVRQTKVEKETVGR
jgi:hypothetical protein